MRLSIFVALVLGLPLGACSEPNAPVDAADVSTDVVESSADVVDATCTNAPTTFDCPLSVAEGICAMHPPCQVCPQNLFPDGGSTVWMAVQQASSCACPPPINAPHG